MKPCEEHVKPVRRSKEEKKLLRKQIRTSHTLLRHEGITTVSQPSKSVVVANGGLGNGVSREQLLEALKETGEVESLVMPPQKPYAFLTYCSEEAARKACSLLNGQQIQTEDQTVTLYLNYVTSVTSQAGVCVSLPEGLLLVQDLVSPEEEALLLSAVNWSSTNDDLTAQKALKYRRVKHYGYEFCYDNNNVDKDKPLPAGLPEECISVLERCVQAGHVDIMPDQLTVNQYQSGQGIPPHVDTHSAFEETILSLSLGAQTVMEYRHPDGRLFPMVLPRRSLLVMKGESRYLWTHGITPRKFDMVPFCDPQLPAALSNLTLSKRDTRTSFTFRKIRHRPCDCDFPSACDSQGGASVSAPRPPSPPCLPLCHADAARLEERYVHRVYDTIASHFSSTRHSPWPRVCHFLFSLVPGSVLADVGCGNGKYLAINQEVFTVGCDRSSSMVQIVSERGHQALVSDALSVPLRSSCCDACISIAVIHHLSTQERRLAAVEELVRLLRSGGRALISVWALEQEYNHNRSKYLKDYSKEHASNRSPIDATLESNQVPDGKLSVHTNRTAFNSQDLLVPWHLKEGRDGGEDRKRSSRRGRSSAPSLAPGSSSGPDSKPKPGPGVEVFHRYYHMFQQGELEALCDRVNGVKVETSYHDQGNWCVILLKD